MAKDSQAQRSELKRVMGVSDVIALAFGTMIGWGWIMLAGKWAESAGVGGAVLAFVIGAIMSIFIGLTYAELTPALPVVGGSVVFAYRAMGYNASWFAGWMITFAYVGVAAWESPATITAIDYLIHIPRAGFLWQVAGFDVYFSWVLIGVFGGIALTIINYIGAKPVAVFQTVATVALAIGGVVFVIGGMVFGSTDNATPMFTNFAGIVVVLLMVPAMFVGFDVIPQASEEMNLPLRVIAKVLILSILLAAAWYILMIIGIALSAPPDVRHQAGIDGIPVADSFAYALHSPLAGKLMIITALCGILTSWNGFILGATRVLFSMGRAKMLPPIFGKVHPKYKTPTAAILLVGIITCISPLLGKSALVWFVDASAFGTVIAYLMVALSFVILRKKEPELARPYKVPAGGLIGILAVGIAVFFIVLYLPIFSGGLIWPVEWLMVIGWCVLGLIFAVMTKKAYPNVSKEEREYLMFGDQYSRPGLIYTGPKAEEQEVNLG